MIALPFTWPHSHSSTVPSAPPRHWRPLRQLGLASAFLLVLGASATAAADSLARHDRLACSAPRFPVGWQEDGDSGTVTLAVLVAPDGQVMASTVLNSSGIGRVDRASLRASARCKFQPGAGGKAAEPAWTRMQYTWVVE